MKKAKKLFGTDGIRGTANQFPMTPDIVLKVGQALGYLLRKNNPNNPAIKVLIGKDTRLSGYMVEMALASGLNSMGVHVQLVGPMPTPGIGFLAQNMRVAAGIVISASHNQFYDNGIKIFGPDGYKISSEFEKEIERLVLEEDLNTLLPAGDKVGRSRRIEDSMGRYVVFAKSTFPLDYTLEGMRIVLDCANGAAYKVAPQVFTELGAEVVVLANNPDGTNINDKVGALYPQKTAAEVVKYRADVGITLDGDADRVVMVDEKGEILNGDHILAICGIHMKKKGKLLGDTVVATQMSNFALDRLMKSHGIRVVRTDVGDKYVVEEMRKHKYVIGGEQSGHIVFLENSTTGDALVGALKVLAVMKEEGRPLSELKQLLQEMPQVLRNVRVSKRADLSTIKSYTEALVQIEDRLSGQGRVFVRFSGTEPLIRILVEGPDAHKISEYADQLAHVLEKELH